MEVSKKLNQHFDGISTFDLLMRSTWTFARGPTILDNFEEDTAATWAPTVPIAISESQHKISID
jgi:hypothetical protein